MRRIVALLLLSSCTDYGLVEHEGTDVFHQNPWEAVDMLLVVDNSCSMAPYQEKLANDFDNFFDYFDDAQVEYRIGVTTTDMMDPEFGTLRGPIIAWDDEDPRAAFSEAVTVGTVGGGYETGLLGAKRVLDAYAAELVRDEASLSVLFVSDEQDSSPGSTAEYVDSYREIKGARERDAVNASALTVTDTGVCTPEQVALSSPGTRYIDVALETAGITANLCAEDFSAIVTELALNTSAMRDTFVLAEWPSPGSLQVSVDDEIWDCHDGWWVYERGVVDDEEVPQIRFSHEHLPISGSRIVARYDFGSGDPADFCTETP